MEAVGAMGPFRRCDHGTTNSSLRLPCFLYAPIVSGSCDEPGEDPGHAGALNDPSTTPPSNNGGMDLMTALVWVPAVLWFLSFVYDRVMRS
jgi:hypothetical protein